MGALAAAGAAGSAAAQTPPEIPQVISPLTVEPDHNAVNLADGKTTIAMPALSVPAAPHLRFDRIQNAAPYVSGSVSDQGAEGSYDRRSYSVHTGEGSADSFRCEDFDCTSITGSGSIYIANVNRFIQAGTGAVYHFNNQHVHTSAPHQTMLYYVSSINYPNGETISYSYQTATLTGDFIANRLFYRPTTITSNLGYAISITYQGSDFNGDTAAWSTPQAVTLYATANPGTPLGRLTYSGDSITDLGGRSYHCSGCTNTLGIDLEVSAGSNQLPGEGSNAAEVTALSGANVIGSVTRDGVAWTYSYDNLRFEAVSNSYLYDHLTVNGPNGYHQVYEAHAYLLSPGSPPAVPPSHRNVITGITDSIGRTTAYNYDESFRPTTITYPEGNSVSIAYDAYGNISWRRTRARLVGGQPDPNFPDIIETANFPADTCYSSGYPVLCYRPSWSRDGLQRQTDYAYNNIGQLTEQLDPADANGVRRRTSITYDASTGISRATKVRICNDPLTTCGTNAPIQTEYDYVGTPSPLLPSAVRQIDAAAGVTLTTTYSYDAAGRLLSTDGPLAGNDDATYNRYDVYGRKTWEIGAAGPDGVRLATRTTYRDSDDKPILVKVGTIASATSDVLTVQRQTATAYDGRRNPVRQTVSAGGTTYSLVERSFDDRGLVQCEARRMNPAVFAASVDACALGEQGTGANDFGPDRITQNIYDAAGQRLQLRQGLRTNAEGTAATWAYNMNGQITTVIDGNGNRAELHYDGRSRQDRWTFPSSLAPSSRPTPFDDSTPVQALATAGAINPNDYEEYGYDLVGDRTSLRKRDGSVITYQYDNLNRMTAKLVPERTSGPQALTAAQTRDVYYGYDLRNAQTYARFDSGAGEGVTNAYDGFGRLASSSTNMGGTARTLSYAYDAAGNRTRITHPDTQFFDYRYDALGRMYGLLENGATWIAALSFNDAGDRAALGRGGTGVVYTYDPVGRLTGLSQAIVAPAAVAWTFGRNPASQIVSTARDNDAYAWAGHYAVNRPYTTNGLNQYTAAGGTNFVYDPNGNLTSDGANAYIYDVENRLVSASGAHNAALTYDPLGRLWQVTNNTTGTVTRFLYDGDALVAEYDAAGAVTARYVHGPGVDEPWFWYDGASVSSTTRRQLGADWQGSIATVTDALGYSLALNTYDEYGIPGAANLGRFQYTGQAWLPELGMYYYKARIYSPTLGRFMQTDPVGYSDQFNLYAYVANDPVNGVDPTGTNCQSADGKDAPCQVDRVVTGAVHDSNGTLTGYTYRDPQAGEFTNLETGMTMGRDAARAVGDNTVDISVPGFDSFSVSGNQIADNVSAATITADPNGIAEREVGRASMSMGPGNLTVYALALQAAQLGQTDLIAVATIHEGIHQTGPELGATRGVPLGPTIHLWQYNGAARQIFQRGRRFP